jgi:hypothetical protein
MPSPFPGMDPYLEEPGLWSDVHGTLIFAMRAQLNALLPDRYTALADRYVWLEAPDGETRVRFGKPDVFLTERPEAATGVPEGAALAAPATATLPMARREGSRYLKVVDRRSRHRVVTVIELLSPSTKAAGEDRDAYLAKRNEYLATGTNLVEIDLLRAGQRLPMGEPAPPAANYYVVVSRRSDFPRIGIWPFSVRDPLPTVPVPLNPEDAPVSLDLKPCLDRAYQEGRYDREVDYATPPDPPLREPDAAWARELLTRRPG